MFTLQKILKKLRTNLCFNQSQEHLLIKQTIISVMKLNNNYFFNAHI